MDAVRDILQVQEVSVLSLPSPIIMNGLFRHKFAQILQDTIILRIASFTILSDGVVGVVFTVSGRL